MVELNSNEHPDLTSNANGCGRPLNPVARRHRKDIMEVTLHSEITCPACGAKSEDEGAVRSGRLEAPLDMTSGVQALLAQPPTVEEPLEVERAAIAE